MFNFIQILSWEFYKQNSTPSSLRKQLLNQFISLIRQYNYIFLLFLRFFSPLNKFFHFWIILSWSISLKLKFHSILNYQSMLLVFASDHNYFGIFSSHSSYSYQHSCFLEPTVYARFNVVYHYAPIKFIANNFYGVGYIPNALFLFIFIFPFVPFLLFPITLFSTFLV